MSGKDDTFVDFYNLLGITFNATFDEIKLAFRHAAKRYHPDLNPDDVDGSSVRFRLVKQAYDVLSEASQRQQYDRQWEVFRRTEEPPEPAASEPQVSEADWSFACRYFGKLPSISERLLKFSNVVEKRWRNAVFFQKDFTGAQELAHSFEDAFLGRLVGTSELLRQVARDAFLCNSIILLQELTSSLRILGMNVTEQIVPQICENSLRALPDDAERHYSEEQFSDFIVFRTEEHENFIIEIGNDLWCRVRGKEIEDYFYRRYFEKAFPYVFAAQRAIDTEGLDYGYRRRERTPESKYGV